MNLGSDHTGALPSFNKIFTIARTTGVAMVTLAGIIVVWLQLVESLA